MCYTSATNARCQDTLKSYIAARWSSAEATICDTDSKEATGEDEARGSNTARARLRM